MEMNGQFVDLATMHPRGECRRLCGPQNQSECLFRREKSLAFVKVQTMI
jgi:hypothetical protein